MTGSECQPCLFNTFGDWAWQDSEKDGHGLVKLISIMNVEGKKCRRLDITMNSVFSGDVFKHGMVINFLLFPQEPRASGK